MTTTAFITVCGSVSDTKWAGLESYANAMSYAMGWYLTPSIITVNAWKKGKKDRSVMMQWGKKIKNRWEDQVGAKLRSIGQQEVSFAVGRLWRNGSEICSLVYNHSCQQRSFCVFFLLQIISASKKSRRKTKDYILKPSCKKTNKMSPPNLSAWGVFFSFPKTILFGISFSLSNPECFGMYGLVGLAELYQCLYGTELQIMRGNYMLEMFGTHLWGTSPHRNQQKQPHKTMWRHQISTMPAWMEERAMLQITRLCSVFSIPQLQQTYFQGDQQLEAIRWGPGAKLCAPNYTPCLVFSIPQLQQTYFHADQQLEAIQWSPGAKLCMPNCMLLFSIPECWAQR